MRSSSTPCEQTYIWVAIPTCPAFSLNGEPGGEEIEMHILMVMTTAKALKASRSQP